MSGMADVLTLHAFHLITPVSLDDVNGPWQVECNCNADPIQGESFLAAEAAFAAHQAAALSDAGFGPVKEAKAEAFEQGQKSAFRHATRLAAAVRMGRPDLPGPMSPNPYRTQA